MRAGRFLRGISSIVLAACVAVALAGNAAGADGREEHPTSCAGLAARPHAYCRPHHRRRDAGARRRQRGAVDRRAGSARERCRRGGGEVAAGDRGDRRARAASCSPSRSTWPSAASVPIGTAGVGARHLARRRAPPLAAGPYARAGARARLRAGREPRLRGRAHGGRADRAPGAPRAVGRGGLRGPPGGRGPSRCRAAAAAFRSSRVTSSASARAGARSTSISESAGARSPFRSGAPIVRCSATARTTRRRWRERSCASEAGSSVAAARSTVPSSTSPPAGSSRFSKRRRRAGRARRTSGHAIAAARVRGDTRVRNVPSSARIATSGHGVAIARTARDR